LQCGLSRVGHPATENHAIEGDRFLVAQEIRGATIERQFDAPISGWRLNYLTFKNWVANPELADRAVGSLGEDLTFDRRNLAHHIRAIGTAPAKCHTV
jgi:hypothetical protein